MNEEIMLDEVQEVPQEGRPVFLTVLCILTWVGSGFQLIGGVINIFTLKMSQKAFENNKMDFSELSKEIPDSNNPGDKFAKNLVEGMGESMDSMIEWGSTLNFVNIGVAIACIVGALLMFQLKKIGFFIYTIATLTAIIVPIALMGSNMVTLLQTSWLAFFGIVFIILYGVNLKHMKN